MKLVKFIFLTLTFWLLSSHDCLHWLAQNTIMLGGTATPGQALGTPTAVQPGSAGTAVSQRVGPPGATGAPVAPTAISAVSPNLEGLSLCAHGERFIVVNTFLKFWSQDCHNRVMIVVKNINEYFWLLSLSVVQSVMSSAKLPLPRLISRCFDKEMSALQRKWQYWPNGP